MNEFIQKYQKTIVGTGAIAVLVLCYFQQKELQRLRAEQKIEVFEGGDIAKGQLIDSLQNENEILNNIIVRYELTFSNLKETYPKAAEEFETFFYTKTE